MALASFLSIPDELLCMICHNLNDLDDVQNLQLSCRLMRFKVKSNRLYT
jgi:hypothetical protein